MTELREQKVSVSELLKTEPQMFGLKLENSDVRRSIFSVQNRIIFLAKLKELNIDVSSQKNIEKYFEKFPDALVQFFVINQPPVGQAIRLGDHYHTQTENNGCGNEVFIFTDVSPKTHIKLEQYHLGKATGEIRYDVKSGSVMENQPNDYHVFTADGPFQMVQVLEGQFKPDDLKKFDVGQWTKGDENVIKGHGLE